MAGSYLYWSLATCSGVSYLEIQWVFGRSGYDWQCLGPNSFYSQSHLLIYPAVSPPIRLKIKIQFYFGELKYCFNSNYWIFGEPENVSTGESNKNAHFLWNSAGKSFSISSLVLIDFTFLIFKHKTLEAHWITIIVVFLSKAKI